MIRVGSKGFLNISIRREHNVIPFPSDSSCHLLCNIYLWLGKPQSFIVIKKGKTSLQFSHLGIKVRIIVFVWNYHNRNDIQKMLSHSILVTLLFLAISNDLTHGRMFWILSNDDHPPELNIYSSRVCLSKSKTWN